MTETTDWEHVKTQIDALYAAVDQLGQTFPGRKFTLDGHLVGSIGEVIAAYMFDLTLNRASTLGHDAIAPDGRQVEVKMTQGSSVAIRHEVHHMLILQKPARAVTRVVYNGPGGIVWQAAGKIGSNGQRPISISKLMLLAKTVPAEQQLHQLRVAPI
jgi:hypothetical protein